MTTYKSNQAVKKWAGIFMTALSVWFVLFILVATNVIPYSRCESWEGDPWVSHCDAPYWDGWSKVAIWVGVFAFVVAGISLVKLLASHNSQVKSKK